MSRRTLRAIRTGCIVILATLLLLEIVLRIFDPLGMVYFDDVLTISRLVVADPRRGYVLPDGVHHLSRFTATVRDGVRVTPDSAPTGCTLVLLGDSVTFGHGVEDYETFGNLLARQYPQVRIVNTGVGGYNSTNVLGSLRAFADADAYLYLMIYNDAQSAVNFERVQAPSPFALVRHINYFAGLTQVGVLGAREQTARFYADLDAIAADARVTLVALDEREHWIPREVVALGYDVHIVPNYRYEGLVISAVDPHPTPAGHAHIAAQLAPLVETLCN